MSQSILKCFRRNNGNMFEGFHFSNYISSFFNRDFEERFKNWCKFGKFKLIGIVKLSASQPFLIS